MPKLQATYTHANTYTLTAIGDSLTENAGQYLTPPELMWPEQLAVKLRALGCYVKARNFGKGGDTTAMGVARQVCLSMYDVPTIGCIFLGINDPGAAIAGATTQANITTLITTLLTAGTTKIVVLNTQYKNWSAGGDTTSTPESVYATLRPFQAAAVTAAANANVVLCDLYAYMRGLIVNATVFPYAGTNYTFVQGDNVWHSSANNQHLNAIGNAVVAAAVLQTIQAQSGWVAALQV